MKIQNTFQKGIINKDLQNRFVDEAELIDAENFFIHTTQGNSAGVGKNALGNVKRTTYNITGGKTVGTGKNETKNKIYDFIKGTTHDYIIEYDIETYNSVIVAQSYTGTRLNFKIGERILNVDIILGDSHDDTLIAWSGDSNPPRIGNIARMKSWGVDGFTADEIMLIKAPPLYPPTVIPINTADEKENFLKDKFLSFATRFKYKDNYYSAISSWQEYSFSPERFHLDFASCENKGMVNAFNACDITFNTGPREVIGIDLLFKHSNSNVVYRVDQFLKAEQGWGNSITIPTPIRFSNSKVFSILPDDQYFRSFDNVPESLVAATIAGNRQMFANYKEGKDLIDKNGDPVVMDYSVGVTSISPESASVPIARLSATSIFDASSIADGKIRMDFTGLNLVKDSAIGVLFNINSVAVSPPLTPTRAVYNFNKSYAVVLSSDYANITALIADDVNNGFKSGIEGYLSDLFLSALVYPTDSLGFPPSVFHGFTLSVISANVIEIVFPSMKYEIEVLPSGPNTFVTEYTKDSATSANLDAVGSKKSMKSYRGNELAVIYKDAQGRKTTGLTSEHNTVFIPLSKSASKNTLTVDMGTTKPPFWATTYKFALKESKGTYEEIYTADFYEDGYFRWVRLEGTSKNKVKEGDTLLVKRDATGIISRPILVKVLEIKTQDADFIASGVSELPGLYMRIKPEGFDMPYNPDSYKEFLGSKGERSGYPSVTLTIPVSTITSNIPEGSVLSVELDSNFSNEDEFNKYSTTIVASSDYPDFQTFFNVQINSIVFQGDNAAVDFAGIFSKSSPAADQFTIQGTSNGRNTVINPKSGILNVKVTLRTTAGFMIFETLGTEIDNGTFYETPDVFDIVDGEHVAGIHSLVKTFNCFSHGNGAESYQIRDAFNEKYVAIDFSPTAVSPDGYKQVNRSVDITYSEVYNSGSNSNKLNEFNLYRANFKDDIEKSYGPIYKIKGMETNLQIYQEDKYSQVFYGKDILYNADGSSNLTSTDKVLGIQDPYLGNYGLSMHPDSVDYDGINTYSTDVKRGVTLKMANNGLFETSSQGMVSYFQSLFRDNKISQINGKYDQYNKYYILNVQYDNFTKYVTWVYSDKDNGWLGRISFNPEDMIRVNGKFFSFKNGEIYEHNSTSAYNTFYGVESPSMFQFNFSQDPNLRKIYKNIETDSTDPWELTLQTDLDAGYIHKEDFEKKEGVYFAYVRTSNAEIDSSLLSCQGIGNGTVTGLVLSFSFDLDSVVSVGDEIRNASLQLVGTIQSKTKNSLTLNTVNNIVSGNFVLCAKPQSIEISGMLGYHLLVSGSIIKNTKTEIFSVNSETVKS